MADYKGPKTYEWLHICCEKAWEKLNDYYQLVNESPVYYMAMAMDPSLKYAWFEQRWNKRRENGKSNGR
jgi:hypothetical protein